MSGVLDGAVDVLSTGTGSVGAGGVGSFAEALDAVRRSRFGAANLPEAVGGHGSSVHDLVCGLMYLAAVDAGVAVALVPHFLLISTLFELAPSPDTDRWLGEAARGALFGEAVSVPATGRPEGVRALARRSRLGAWTFSAECRDELGAAWFDWVLVRARVAGGRRVKIMVPLDRAGVSLRPGETRSRHMPPTAGTIELRRVVVHADDLVPDDERSPAHETLEHLLRAAITLGVLEDAAHSVAANGHAQVRDAIPGFAAVLSNGRQLVLGAASAGARNVGDDFARAFALVLKALAGLEGAVDLVTRARVLSRPAEI